MNKCLAIETIIGDRWDDRVVLREKYGPMQEVFHVPGQSKADEGDVREVWWYGTYEGKQYGAYIRVPANEIDEASLEEDAEILYLQACDTMDRLANDALGLTSRSLPLVDMFRADLDLFLVVSGELAWLNGSEWREGDLESQHLDRFWQYRASRRKHLLEEFGL